MHVMGVSFYQLNHGWNAEPNAPDPQIEIVGNDLLLSFDLNAFQFEEFNEGDRGILRFTNCSRYRLGHTNDEGWYVGQCRFSRLAPEWGEFYRIKGDLDSFPDPGDWVQIAPVCPLQKHFLFYFRDNTFECDADECHTEGERLQIRY